MMTGLPAELDLWADVSWDDLPPALVDAFERADWRLVRSELQSQLDGIITDGPLGRELLQLVRKVPWGSDAILDRYRAATAIDYGDWDDLRQYLALRAEPPAEFIGLSQVITAPVDSSTLPSALPHHVDWFKSYDQQLQAASGASRHRIRRLRGRYGRVLWNTDYVSINRYLRYRGLHDAAFGATTEAHGGRVPVALALAREAQNLGLEQEPLHVLSRDFEYLLQLALGMTAARRDLATPRLIAGPTGLSPWGTWEFLRWLAPFIVLTGDNELATWCANVAVRVAERIASPRALLQAETWRIASLLIGAGHRVEAARALPGLLAQAQGAAPGLRAVPELIHGALDPSESTFALAERLGRRSGNVWLEVSALAWMLSVNPAPNVARRLLRLLRATGWRRPILTPPSIASEAAIAMVTVGLRGAAIVEFAAAAGRASVTLLVAARHLDDADAPRESQIAAIHAVRRLGTNHSRELLAKISRCSEPELAQAARSALEIPRDRPLVSEREAEVLELAGRGLTNKQIGQQLFLSQHTVARHLANARAKLGASSRVDAVIRAIGRPTQAS